MTDRLYFNLSNQHPTGTHLVTFTFPFFVGETLSTSFSGTKSFDFSDFKFKVSVLLKNPSSWVLSAGFVFVSWSPSSIDLLSTGTVSSVDSWSFSEVKRGGLGVESRDSELISDETVTESEVEERSFSTSIHNKIVEDNCLWMWHNDRVDGYVTWPCHMTMSHVRHGKCKQSPGSLIHLWTKR